VIPRKARIDYPGALHHVIFRGNRTPFLSQKGTNLPKAVVKVSVVVRYATLETVRGGAGAPLSRPSVLKSSSISGQCIPKPPPQIRQFLRCSFVACSNRGCQVKGTVIVRPSRRSTLNVSSVKCKFFTRSPGLISEVFIPSLGSCQINFLFFL
jgi:hypothetical protein